MRLLPRLAGFALVLLLTVPASAVTIDWVTVGNPGNACESQSRGCFGAVGYTYHIGAYEITTSQYAEFLNSVAASDPNGLYNFRSGINRSGNSGSFTYSVVAGRENWPVNYVRFYDALRFVNWLDNGQPIGAQNASTTEDGAYTFSGTTTVGGRNPGAMIVLPSEDEWYKAAYYDPASASYRWYPTGTGFPTCAAPSATPETANCENAVGSPTNVGAYTASTSAYGTFDQGGNVFEWNEAPFGTSRGMRGGAYNYTAVTMGGQARNFDSPWAERPENGFRVAMVPEPGTGLLVTGGLLVLTGWRRARK